MTAPAADSTLFADVGAERALLGFFVWNPTRLWECPLSGDDLTDPHHRAVLGAMLALLRAESPLDLVTITAELKRQGAQVPVDVVPDCIEQAGPTPLPYVELLRACSQRRTLRVTARAFDQIATDATADPAESAQREVDRLLRTLHAEQDDRLVDLGTAAIDRLAQLAARRDGNPDEVQTGFRDLDAILGGMPRGELALLAGRPGMGKSALAGQIAVRVAARGAGVCLCTPEMSRAQQADRLLAWATAIPLQRIRVGALNRSERAELEDAARSLPRTLWLLDRVPQTTGDVHAAAARAKARSGLDLLVVDHLGWLADRLERGESRAALMGRITKALKACARSLGCALLVVAQLNRACEERVGDHRPVLSDLRDSGELEQDADTVLFVYRPAYYDKAASPNAAEIIVAKNRQGPPGDVSVLWYPSTASFADAPLDGWSTRARDGAT